MSTAVMALLLLSGIAAFGSGERGASEVPSLPAPAPAAAASDFPFNATYPTLAGYYSWFDALVGEYPGLVTKIDIGNSYQGRDIWVLRLRSDEEGVTGERPSVLVEGNIHAREWSASNAACYFMWWLLSNYETNDTIHWLLNNRDIYILPMVNPDGYYYDGNGGVPPGDMWRKNRNTSTPDGVDLNRNWDIAWASGDSDPYSETYHGASPFSEYETKCISQFMTDYGIDSFQCLHSYAGVLLIPWCYTNSWCPHNSWYRATASRMTSLTSLFGNQAQHYGYGQAGETIGYTAPGGSIDWAYDALGAQSYCFELETGGAGFYPGTSSIMTINRDVDDALLYQARIADTDLGDGTADLFPPTPYILYGSVRNQTAPLAGEMVILTNTATSEMLSAATDSNGYYELDFGRLSAYTTAQTFRLTASSYILNFTIGSEWGKRIDLTGQAEPWSDLTVERWGPLYNYNVTSETRYLRGLAGEASVNGLTAYSLGRENSGTSGNWAPGNNLQVHLGMRVWKRSAAGAETEITSGSPAATVSRTSTGLGYQTAAWTPPETALDPTDSIVVRVYGDTAYPPSSLRAEFTTEQLGATRLESQQWTVQYWTRFGSIAQGGSDWFWGTSGYDNHISGFGHSVVVSARDPHRDNMLNWTASSSQDLDHYAVYRSDSQTGLYGLIGQVPATKLSYTDTDRGNADYTLWWYAIREVDILGNEEGNSDDVCEPGGTSLYNIDLTGMAAGQWAFVSYPLDLAGAPASVLDDSSSGDGGTDWDVAKAWDNQQKIWLTYRKGGSMNTFSQVDNRMGVWLHLTQNGGDQMLTLAGDQPGPVGIGLLAGWNMVGYPSMTPRLASDTLPAQADTVSVWQASSPYISDLAPGSVTMSHGHAYWVRVTADCVWIVSP